MLRRLGAAALGFAVFALGGCADFDRLEADALAELGRRDSGQATGDAGAVDAGASDAGVSDAGVSDAGASDAGASDAGAFDAGAFDAGAFDAGAFDGGASDAGAFDAGARDAGLDASTPDSGVDAGPVDAGRPPRILSLRLRWYRTVARNAAREEPGFVLAADAGLVLLGSSRADSNGTLSGDVYAWHGESGDVALQNGGLMPVPPRATLSGEARAYTLGRITSVNGRAGLAYVSTQLVLVDGGRPTMEYGAFQHFVRAHSLDAFRGDQTYEPLDGEVPFATTVVTLADGGLRWVVLTDPLDGGAPGQWGRSLTSGFTLDRRLASGCAPPTTAVGVGSAAIFVSRCTPGPMLVVSSLDRGLSQYMLSFSSESVLLAQPPLGSAPGVAPLGVRLETGLQRTTRVHAFQLAFSDAGLSLPSTSLATDSTDLRLVGLTVDAEGRPYVLLELTGPARHNFVPEGATDALPQSARWVVLGLRANGELRWAGTVDVPGDWDSNGLAVSGGRLFLEARCRTNSLTGPDPEDGGFCQADTGNVLLRLEAADGGML